MTARRAVELFDTVLPMEGLLSLRSVWLSFPRGRRHVVRVLADVSLDVQPGEVVAVLAQRAQGKTSLLRVAAGMDRPDRGSVLFAGEDLWRASGVHGWTMGRRRARLQGAQIALVGRREPDVGVAVLESVALPLAGVHSGGEARERAERALEDVGAGECVQRRWGELADSERARVALAQAIARDPKLLLVDDLTATLELGETEEIARRLHMLASERGLSVLMGVGDARATGWSERLATLAGGELLMAPASPEPPVEDYSNVVNFPGG